MVNPIHGQPGGFFAGANPLHRGFSGLGNLRQDAIRTKLVSVTASYNTTMTNATKLLAAFGPLDASALLALGVALKSVKERDPTAIARLTGAQFAGIIRMALAAAKGNLVRAEAIVNGNLPGHEAITERLLGAAEDLLGIVGGVVNNATAAVGTAEGYARAVGLGALGVFGPDDAAVAAVIAVGVLLLAALAFSVYVYVHQSQAASDAADQACAAGAANGHPCTSSDWSAAHAAAAAAERTLSPIPNLQPLVQQAGSLLFWGGLAVVAAAIGYGVWTTAPAAMTVRSRLQAKSERLQGIYRGRRR